jgi:YfiH family protein
MEADATFSHSQGDLVSVLTADCIPSLLYHPQGVVAAIHAGWRGLANEIIPKSLKMLPPNPLAVIGPSIGPCCYEVGEDLADEFKARFGTGVVEQKSKPHLNLAQVAILQLQHSGVEEMDVCLFCTFCHSELFFSFRRDGSSGRMMSFIGLR